MLFSRSGLPGRFVTDLQTAFTLHICAMRTNPFTDIVSVSWLLQRCMMKPYMDWPFDFEADVSPASPYGLHANQEKQLLLRDNQSKTWVWQACHTTSKHMYPEAFIRMHYAYGISQQLLQVHKSKLWPYGHNFAWIRVQCIHWKHGSVRREQWDRNMLFEEFFQMWLSPRGSHDVL